MMADTLDELHAMADRIGVQRKWFQDTMSGPHYDIALSKRVLAVAAGAREVTLRQMAAMAWHLRTHDTLGDPATVEAIMIADFKASKAGQDLQNAVNT